MARAYRYACAGVLALWAANASAAVPAGETLGTAPVISGLNANTGNRALDDAVLMESITSALNGGNLSPTQEKSLRATRGLLLLFNANDVANALKEFDAALLVQPDPFAFYGRGIVHIIQNDQEAAMYDLARAI